MKNRKKLADDQLDAVSGGTAVRESEENIKKLEQNKCPLCGNELYGYYDDGAVFYLCKECRVEWTKYYGYWQRYVDTGSSC